VEAQMLPEGFSIRFANDGGPMIVIPRELMPAWHGADWTPGADTRFEPHDPRSNTHYSWACACSDWIAVLPFETGQVIVLNAGEQVENLRWLRLAREPRPLLIGWVEDDEQQTVLDALRSHDDLDWEVLAADFHLQSDELVLMHGACTGTEVREMTESADGLVGIGEAIPCRLGRGTYRVEIAKLTLSLDSWDAEYPLCRFRPTS
jgi:hypothetical protein